MIAHVSGVPVEELLLWVLSGGTALVTARVWMNLLIGEAGHPHTRRAER